MLLLFWPAELFVKFIKRDGTFNGVPVSLRETDTVLMNPGMDHTTHNRFNGEM